MARWRAMQLLDVKGAFICGNFENGKRIYMEVPQGFEQFFPKNAVLLLLKKIHGLKQGSSFGILERTIEGMQKYEVWKK